MNIIGGYMKQWPFSSNVQLSANFDKAQKEKKNRKNLSRFV